MGGGSKGSSICPPPPQPELIEVHPVPSQYLWCSNPSSRQGQEVGEGGRLEGYTAAGAGQIPSLADGPNLHAHHASP